MPRSPLQFKIMKEERQLQILEAALPLFALYGIKGVSIDAIATKAKCSHGLIYHYYKNSAEVYDTLLKSETYKIVYEKMHKNRKELSDFDALNDIISTIWDFLQEGTEVYCFVVLLINEEGNKSISSVLKNLIRRCQNQNLINGGDPEELTEAFLDTVRGIIYPRILDKKYNKPIPNCEIVNELFRKRVRV